MDSQRFCRYFILFLLATKVICSEAAFSDSLSLPLSQRLLKIAPDLKPQIANLASTALSCATAGSKDLELHKLGIIDYSLSSTKKRFWLFDLEDNQLLLKDLVAHGKNSGEDLPDAFSNTPGSLMSSLGLFRIGERYIGKHGNSIRLIGLEPGVNDMALDRAIVIHGANYVSSGFIRTHQRLGRSFGCPAFSPAIADKVIEHFEVGPSYLFAYYPDDDWLQNSKLLSSCNSR